MHSDELPIAQAEIKIKLALDFRDVHTTTQSVLGGGTSTNGKHMTRAELHILHILCPMEICCKRLKFYRVNVTALFPT